jgi:hypothetical protein
VLSYLSVVVSIQGCGGSCSWGSMVWVGICMKLVMVWGTECLFHVVFLWCHAGVNSYLVHPSSSEWFFIGTVLV